MWMMCPVFFCLWLHQAQHELRVAQTEFDRQAEVTRLLLEGISSTHVSTCAFHTRTAFILDITQMQKPPFKSSGSVWFFWERN